MHHDIAVIQKNPHRVLKTFPATSGETFFFHRVVDMLADGLHARRGGRAHDNKGIAKRRALAHVHGDNIVRLAVERQIANSCYFFIVSDKSLRSTPLGKSPESV